MEKILSIDFDCIMYPCIKLYNDSCHGNENPTVEWKNIESRQNIDNFLCYDAKILEEIALLIQRNVKNGSKLIPITNHQDIVEYINLVDNEKIELANIDFHHDIWYDEDSIDRITHFDEYTCANWVGYLYFKNKLDSYTWVKMPNSDLFMPSNEDVPLTVLRSTEIKDLSNDFDRIFLCLSPQWVPYKFHHLYDLIVKLFGGNSL